MAPGTRRRYIFPDRESPPVVLLHKEDTQVVSSIYSSCGEKFLCVKVIRRGTHLLNRKSVTRKVVKDSIMSCISQGGYASQPIMRSYLSRRTVHARWIHYQITPRGVLLWSQTAPITMEFGVWPFVSRRSIPREVVWFVGVLPMSLVAFFPADRAPTCVISSGCDSKNRFVAISDG